MAAPSANPFGYLSPTRAEHVRCQLGDKVDLILDGGPARVGLESTVLDLCAGQPRILRPGAAPQEAIEALVGPVLTGPAAGAAEHAAQGPVSPGQLKSHYAPRTPLSVHAREEIIALGCEGGEAFLFFDGSSRDAWLAGPGKDHSAVLVRALSENGDTLEAASCLFEILHELDRSGVSRIYAQLAPGGGLGPAINDRLCRASALKQ